ncbi:hypothetical protein BB561_004403 [Smittium simulii]|uniref:Pyruvate dehydrogenase E1 component subunit alpha n=1 Tax=Smittium simulii TaxID=133385 RepID=A0A2T9YGC7_9FUNG|nr:hypothetical protein BB561_004403 [Smittium simulii]
MTISLRNRNVASVYDKVQKLRSKPKAPAKKKQSLKNSLTKTSLSTEIKEDATRQSLIGTNSERHIVDDFEFRLSSPNKSLDFSGFLSKDIANHSNFLLENTSKRNRQSEMFLYVDDSKFADILSRESSSSAATFSLLSSPKSNSLNTTEVGPLFEEVGFGELTEEQFGKFDKNTLKSKISADSYIQQDSDLNSENILDLNIIKVQNKPKTRLAKKSSNGVKTTRSKNKESKAENNSIEPLNSKQDIKEENQPIKPTKLKKKASNITDNQLVTTSSSSGVDVISKKFIKKSNAPISKISWLTDDSVGNSLPKSCISKHDPAENSIDDYSDNIDQTSKKRKNNTVKKLLSLQKTKLKKNSKVLNDKIKGKASSKPNKQKINLTALEPEIKKQKMDALDIENYSSDLNDYKLVEESMQRLVSSTRSCLSQRSLVALANNVRAMSTSSDPKLSFTIPESSFTGHRLDSLPETTIEMTKSEALKIYSEMQVVRRLEMAADAAYKAKLIRGFCHLCTGQEAIPVGIETAITKLDSVITSYRCHGFTYTRGVPPAAILAELMGRKNGCSQGKGGSMHLFGDNFFGGNGIVGAQVPLGAGLAFKHKYLNEKACSISLYGDGAANQGQVEEAFNMSKLWDLPAIYICENNKYGMGTSAGRAAADTKYYTRGGIIPGMLVNGMDVLAVIQSIKYSRDFTISGNGPIVLEMNTYRYGGHSMSDPGTTYRTREEIQHMRSTSDPITGYKSRLLETGEITEDELKAIDKKAKVFIDIANAEAKASPEPSTSDLFDHVYASPSDISSLRGRTLSETHYY